MLALERKNDGATTRQAKGTTAAQLQPAVLDGNKAGGELVLVPSPDYIPAEAFLESLGYFTPSSKRITHIYVKEKAVAQKIEPDGTKRTIKTKISANHELGLPITSDFDYYRAFLKICSECVDRNGRFRLPIAVPTKTLIRYAGKVESAKEKKEARDWLRRMTATLVEGGIYRAKTKVYQEGFIGTLFSQVIISGERMRDGTVAETNYVWLSPWFLSNYFYHYLRSIDFNFHRRLRKPIAKALYPLLETGWYASGGQPYSKSYSDLCEEFLLTEYTALSRAKQQLDPAHQELVVERFLAKYEYRESADKQGYVITYYPGEKFFQDQQARAERKQRAEQMSQKSQIPPSTSPHETNKNVKPVGESKPGKELLVQEILEVTGDPKNKGFYFKLITTVDEQIIYRALSETKEAARQGIIRTTRAKYFTNLVKRLAEGESAGTSQGQKPHPEQSPHQRTVKSDVKVEQEHEEHQHLKGIFTSLSSEEQHALRNEALRLVESEFGSNVPGKHTLTQIKLMELLRVRHPEKRGRANKLA